MVERNEDESPCAACAGLGVVVVDSYANGRERHDEVPCDECVSPWDEGDEYLDDESCGEAREPDAMAVWL